MEVVKDLVSAPPIWDEANQEALLQPYDHIASKPGKNFRSKLIGVFNLIYGISEDKITLITTMVDILHNASLLIDDIEDNSQIRRGLTASHLIFGTPMTINTANYMYFRAMEILQDIAGNDNVLLKDLMAIFNEEMINLHRGQGLDIYWRDSLPKIIPDDQMYFNMVMNKTGGLFRLTVKILERLTTENLGFSLVPLSNLLGIIYQVRDDYKNLLDRQMIANKGLAEDISEGKLSFPIIHGLRFGQQNNDNTLMYILKQRTTDTSLKLEAIDYLQNTSNSMDFAKQTIEELTALAKSDEYIPLRTHAEASAQLLNVVEYLSKI